jgi:hypothetical protein
VATVFRSPKGDWGLAKQRAISQRESSVVTGGARSMKVDERRLVAFILTTEEGLVTERGEGGDLGAVASQWILKWASDVLEADKKLSEVEAMQQALKETKYIQT